VCAREHTTETETETETETLTLADQLMTSSHSEPQSLRTFFFFAVAQSQHAFPDTVYSQAFILFRISGAYIVFSV
jgi:hypothetical protein